MTWTTLSIKDEGGTARTMRVWDESGVGTGPYSFGHRLSDGAGGGDTPATETSLAAVLAKIIAAPATSAKQDTAQTALDAIKTAVELLDNAVGGTELQVDVVAALPAGTNTIGKVTLTGRGYETVAASQTAQALGATGATGDHLSHLVIIPATTSPGAVAIKDGAGSAITVFTGGASSVGSLVPFAIPIDAISAAGAWQVTTGTNVSVFAVGTFT